MAKGNVHRLFPEGRRLQAPPRRLPAPANDNAAPVGQRLKRYAILATIAALAIGLTLFSR